MKLMLLLAAVVVVIVVVVVVVVVAVVDVTDLVVSISAVVTHQAAACNGTKKSNALADSIDSPHGEHKQQQKQQKQHSHSIFYFVLLPKTSWK